MSDRDQSYIQALDVTKKYGEPPVGFTQASEAQIPSQLQRLIKQNNVIIELLVQVTRSQKQLQEQVSQLSKGKQKEVDTDFQQAVDELTQKVGALQIGEKAPPTRVRRVYFYEDPLKKVQDALAEARK